MMFYYYHYLTSVDKEKEDPFYLKPVPLKFKNKTYSKSRIRVIRKENVCFIYFLVTSTQPFEQDIGRITLSTVMNNCGAIHLSNLESNHKGAGSYILNEVKRWLTLAGYTLVFCNTAGEQNDFVPTFWKKHGFYQMMPHNYKNLRSDNTNIWLYHILDETAIIPKLTKKKGISK